MDWLSIWHTTLDCFAKKICFRPDGQSEFCYQGERDSILRGYVSAIRVEKMICHGCEAYLAFVSSDSQNSELKIQVIPVIIDFSDVFSDELQGLPPDREIEFAIEIQPGTDPISIPPYRLAPAELKELEVQLRELLDKSFIRPSVLPSGALILFVKKKNMRITLDQFYRL